MEMVSTVLTIASPAHVPDDVSLADDRSAHGMHPGVNGVHQVQVEGAPSSFPMFYLDVVAAAGGIVPRPDHPTVGGTENTLPAVRFRLPDLLHDIYGALVPDPPTVGERVPAAIQRILRALGDVPGSRRKGEPPLGRLGDRRPKRWAEREPQRQQEQRYGYLHQDGSGFHRRFLTAG